MVIIRNWGWAGVGRNSGFLWNWGNVRGYEKKRHSARTRSLEQKFAFNFIKFHNRPQNFLTFPRTDLFRTNMNHSLKMRTFQIFRRIYKMRIKIVFNFKDDKELTLNFTSKSHRIDIGKNSENFSVWKIVWTSRYFFFNFWIFVSTVFKNFKIPGNPLWLNLDWQGL